ncbi:galactokinase [Kocuria sp. cx-116]|uniref:galactokinase n=1 Tax=Kocuria sp. cx-116 TaxID=2771378 RepID=UPI001685FFC5|nr:galactokinase [Kocuria sp. cx-116]MBD2763117.1 galactokinase [Kocuria sp. cx-116]
MTLHQPENNEHAERTRAERLARRFTELYGHAPDGVWCAPGRVNLIGEHTDYNDGLVLPFAIDRAAMVAMRLKSASDPAVGIADLASTYAPDGGDFSHAAFTVAELAPGSVDGWGAYPAGVAYVLSGLGGVVVPGFELLLDSSVPTGAGLSSSHAVEVATIVALNDLLGLGLNHPDLARLTQRAENEFVGAPTGIMDQSASLMGRAGGALFLDCRTLESEVVPLPLAEHGLSVLVIDTKVAHSHAHGGYAARRASCERAATTLGVTSLRDLPTAADAAPAPFSGTGVVPGASPTGDAPSADIAALDSETARRVRHVLTENRRVLETVERLRQGDLSGVGKLMTASHVSLRDDYEVSCLELDLAVDSALNAGARGARMTGGGFGGSTIALVHTIELDQVRDAVVRAFADHDLRTPDTFTVLPADGARRVL